MEIIFVNCPKPTLGTCLSLPCQIFGMEIQAHKKSKTTVGAYLQQSSIHLKHPISKEPVNVSIFYQTILTWWWNHSCFLQNSTTVQCNFLGSSNWPDESEWQVDRGGRFCKWTTLEFDSRLRNDVVSEIIAVVAVLGQM